MPNLITGTERKWLNSRMIWSWMPWCSVSCMPWLGKCFARVSVEDGSSSSSQYNCTFLFFLNSHFTLKETFGFFFQEASVTLTCLTNGSACDSPLDIQGSCVPSGATCCPHKSVSVCSSEPVTCGSYLLCHNYFEWSRKRVKGNLKVASYKMLFSSAFYFLIPLHFLLFYMVMVKKSSLAFPARIR